MRAPLVVLGLLLAGCPGSSDFGFDDVFFETGFGRFDTFEGREGDACLPVDVVAWPSGLVSAVHGTVAPEVTVSVEGVDPAELTVGASVWSDGFAGPPLDVVDDVVVGTARLVRFAPRAPLAPGRAWRLDLRVGVLVGGELPACDVADAPRFHTRDRSPPWGLEGASWLIPGTGELGGHASFLARLLGTDRALAIAARPEGDGVAVTVGTVTRAPGWPAWPCDPLDHLTGTLADGRWTARADALVLDDLVAPVVLRDVVLGGDATGSDTAAAGLGLSGLLDLRSWPSDALDAACELALVRGVPCRPCPDAPDGPAACVQLDARAMIGAAHGALEEPSSACVGG